MKYKMRCTIEEIGDVKHVGQKSWPKLTLYASDKDEERDFIRAFDCFGEEAVDSVQELTPGDVAEITFRVKGREYQGRVFVDLAYVSHTVLEKAVPTAAPPEPEQPRLVDMTAAEDPPF